MAEPGADLGGVARLLCRWLRVPEAPEPPGGEGLLTFRAGKQWFRYRMVLWAVMRFWTLMIFLWLGGVVMTITLGIASKVAPAPEDQTTLGMTAQQRRKQALVKKVDPAVVRTIVVVVVGLLASAYLAHAWLTYVLARLDYELRYYMVTDRSLRIREGVWWVREMTVSFANVQNVSILRGPLQQMCGVADVVVETAGGGGATDGRTQNQHMAVFRGVENAESLKELIMTRQRQHRDAGLGEGPSVLAPAAPVTSAAALSGDALAVLRELRDEARAFRAAAERRTTSA